MLRSQYSLAFKPDDLHDGKAHKIVVKVDVDGDGVYDEKTFVVQARQYRTMHRKTSGAVFKTSKQESGQRLLALLLFIVLLLTRVIAA